MNNLARHLFQQYQHSKILILGWAREGQSSYQLLRSVCPEADISVSDNNEALITNWMNEQQQKLTISPYLQNLSDFDVIFKTPGVPVHIPELQEYLASGGVITSQLNEFLNVYRDQCIGITGTKGKSTTSSLIYQLYTAAGKETLLAGNIGLPVFEIVDQVQPTTTIIIEMSSYQLETVTASPHIAILLNLYAEHLNYHRTIENYVFAKAKITAYQNAADVLIFNQDSPELATTAQQSPAQKIPFSYHQAINYPGETDTVLAQLVNVELPGTIKRWNVLPALLTTSELDLSAEQIIDALKAFQPLPHRLETVSNQTGIPGIDDTLATIPEATIAALETVPKVDVLILGGYDRGISYQKIVETCIDKHVPAIAFFKPSGQIMMELIKNQYSSDQWPRMQIVETMAEAVAFAQQHAPEGGTVLLSPSSPSFGQFADYRDKSAQFRAAIEKLSPT